MRITLTLIAIVVYTFATIGIWGMFKNPNDVNGDGVVNMQDLSIVAFNLDD